uniref:Uncharacterized protein n=1 Tax=Trichogramma kaykai TaxID=54128 RepID=A0ABD2WH77_9HYME
MHYIHCVSAHNVRRCCNSCKYYLHIRAARMYTHTTKLQHASELTRRRAAVKSPQTNHRDLGAAAAALYASGSESNPRAKKRKFSFTLCTLCAHLHRARHVSSQILRLHMVYCIACIIRHSNENSRRFSIALTQSCSCTRECRRIRERVDAVRFAIDIGTSECESSLMRDADGSGYTCDASLGRDYVRYTIVPHRYGSRGHSQSRVNR